MVFTAKLYNEDNEHIYSTPQYMTPMEAVNHLEALYDPETDSKIEITWTTP